MPTRLLVPVALALTTPALAAPPPWFKPPKPEVPLDVEVAATYSCALTSCGDVVCWGARPNGVPPRIRGGFDQIAVGDAHVCALGRGGAVACFGSDDPGAVDAPDLVFTQIEAAERHTCGVTVDGDIACWGRADHGADRPPDGFTFTEVSTSPDHSCGLRDDGEVTCWGWNDQLQATPPTPSQRHDPSTDMVLVSTGRYHSVVASEVTVYSFGWDVSGAVSELGDPIVMGHLYRQSFVDEHLDPVQLSAGLLHTCLLAEDVDGAPVDGNAYCWGDDRYGQASPPPGMFRDIAAGAWHTCAVTDDDQVRCWGLQDDGQTAPPAFDRCPVRSRGTASTATWR